MWRSIAKMLCGAPNPRNAPCGGALVATACELDAHIRAVVRPGRVNRAARKHHGRKRRVRAAIDREIDVHRHQLAVARHAGAMPRARRMPLGGRHHVFGAVVDHFHAASRISTPAAPRAPRSSTDILPCRRIRRRFPPGSRESFPRASRTAASAPCARSTDIAASPTR